MVDKHKKKIEKYKNKIKKFKNKLKKIKYTENFTTTTPSSTTPSSTTKPKSTSDPEKFPGWAIGVICGVVVFVLVLVFVYMIRTGNTQKLGATTHGTSPPGPLAGRQYGQGPASITVPTGGPLAEANRG